MRLFKLTGGSLLQSRSISTRPAACCATRRAVRSQSHLGFFKQLIGTSLVCASSSFQPLRSPKGRWYTKKVTRTILIIALLTHYKYISFSDIEENYYCYELNEEQSKEGDLCLPYWGLFLPSADTSDFGLRKITNSTFSTGGKEVPFTPFTEMLTKEQQHHLY